MVIAINVSPLIGQRDEPGFSQIHCRVLFQYVDLDRIDFASNLARVQPRFGRGIVHYYIRSSILVVSDVLVI